MSLSDIIKMNQYPSYYDDNNDNNEEDYGDEINNVDNYKKYKQSNDNSKLKSNILNTIIVLLIIFLFSSTFYTKIDELTVNSGIRFFTKEGEPNLLLITLQFILLFLLMKIISKY
jgi:hypothetical protein